MKSVRIRRSKRTIMTIVRSSAYSSREWEILVSVVIAHRCLVVRIVCNNYLTSRILVRYGLTTRFTPIFIVVLRIVDGPRFHVPVSGAY